MNDLHFTTELREIEWVNIHSGVRDNSYTHASAIGDKCLYRTLLTRIFGDIPDESLNDGDTKDKFAWGINLEDEPSRRILQARPKWSIARGGVKGRKGRFTLRDDGTGRSSPTFVIDESINLGGAIDAILHIPKKHAHDLIYPSGQSVQIYGNIPFEMTTMARKTLAGGIPGETLWNLMQDKEDVFNYMLDPAYNMRWIRKKAAQMLAYLHLYNAPVGLLTILIKSVGRLMAIWVIRDEYTSEIDQLLRYAEMVETDVNLPPHKREIFRTDNWKLCGWCPYFKEHCAEHIAKRDEAETISNKHLLELIERVQEGQSLRAEVKNEEQEMTTLLKDYLPKEGDANSIALMGGRYLVKVSKTYIEEKTVNDYPPNAVIKRGHWRYNRMEILEVEK